ncbi:S-adenosyl-L-methionine-dependent methyltransferase [Xylariales sp. PMI_506]|nr:S-adenosyl-L-methionine-dependent methyltransferase [Xylariales sp. PMI_506]
MDFQSGDDGSSAVVEEAATGPSLPRIPIPVLPSQVLGSYNSTPVPSYLYSEDLAMSAVTIDHKLSQAPSDAPVIVDSSFALTANDLVNKILNRTPTGGSVVDPESVIGESLRLYHGYKDGKYFMPNDAAEQDRLDLQHELFRILFDGWLSLAPFSKAPEYVLDIGTGTGLWAFEFAEQNPSSYVIGADLSAIQPTYRDIPNCEFVKSDIEDDWVFPIPYGHTRTGHDNNIRFDYVHLRLMFTCFNDPKTVMKHAFDNLRSGGWIEFQETSGKMFQGNPGFQGDAIQRWAIGCAKGALAVGRDITCVPKYKQWLEEIGFVDVTERKMLFPIGAWPRDPKLNLAGRYCLQDILEGIRGVGYKMLRLSGMTAEEVETLISQCQVELRDLQNHSYWVSYVICGRKP